MKDQMENTSGWQNIWTLLQLLNSAVINKMEKNGHNCVLIQLYSLFTETRGRPTVYHYSRNKKEKLLILNFYPMIPPPLNLILSDKVVIFYF